MTYKLRRDLFILYRGKAMGVLNPLVLFLLLTVLSIPGTAQSPSFKTFMNPVIPGDHPDPNLFRDGRDYFTTGSSFNTTPKIYHSTDLVHWEVSGQPFDPGWSELDDCVACGVWGGCLAYFAGSYWDYFGLKGSMWFVKSSSPYGPWSTPVKMRVPPGAVRGLGIDNSIFVDDDGAAYLVAKPGQPANQIFRLDSTGQCTGEMIDLGWINPPPDYPYSWAEGPVMCKKDGYYYYFVAGNAAGGEYAFRSDTLTGDQSAWQVYGDIFQTDNRSGSLFYGPNHSSYPVETDNGSWWAILHSWSFTPSTHEWHGQGRQGLLSQVNWSDDGRPLMDWPVNAPQPAPLLPSGGIPWMVPKSDFFDQDVLNMEWEFFGKTPSSMYSLTERPGWLRIKPGAGMKHIMKNDAEHAYTLMTRVDFDATGTGDEAGLRITNGLDGTRNLDARLCSTFDGLKKVLRFSFNGKAYTATNAVGNRVWLKLVRSDHILRGFFSANGYAWKEIGDPVDVSALDKEQPDTNGWIGNRQGLYALNRQADFDLYIYRDGYTPIQADCPANQCGYVKNECFRRFTHFGRDPSPRLGIVRRCRAGPSRL